MKLPEENYKYCKYNLNREAYKIVLPYCNFPIENLKMPPNVYIGIKNIVDEETCANCKVFEKE